MVVISRDSEIGEPAHLPAQVAGRWGLIKLKENTILYWVYYTSQGRTKLYCTGTTSLMNQTKEERLSFVLFVSQFTSVSTVCRGHPSLVSLVISFPQPDGITDKLTDFHLWQIF
jgi:hypothetical protein